MGEVGIWMQVNHLLGMDEAPARFGKATDGASFSLYLDQIIGPMSALHLILQLEMTNLLTEYKLIAHLMLTEAEL